MKILVTGGAGFIGSNIVAKFAYDHQVTVCDFFGDSATGKWKNLAKHPVNIINPNNLFDWLQDNKPNIIIHMGAISSTTETDVDAIIGANFELSRDLFQYCAVRNVRFIYASSAATYGASNSFIEHQDWKSLSNLRPLNPYGWSKALFDTYAVRSSENRAPPQWVGLKFFNVYGPNEEHKDNMRSVISQIYSRIVSGKSVHLFRSCNPEYEDGGQLRDFVFVDDVVNVIDWLIKTPNVSGIYNVGSGKARSFRDLAEITFKVAEREPKIKFIDMPIEIRDKYQYFTEASMDQLRNVGYFMPMTSLENGIEKYVKNYLSQPDIFR